MSTYKKRINVTVPDDFLADLHDLRQKYVVYAGMSSAAICLSLMRIGLYALSEMKFNYWTQLKEVQYER